MEAFKACSNSELACLHEGICESIVRRWLSVNCYKRNSNFYKHSMNRQEFKWTAVWASWCQRQAEEGWPGLLTQDCGGHSQLPRQGFLAHPEVPWGVLSPLSGKVWGSVTPVSPEPCDILVRLQCLHPAKDELNTKGHSSNIGNLD